MAEVVGLVASSFTLLEIAEKVTSGLFRLKRLWDEVKDVPETIGDILARLDVLLPVVVEIEKDFRDGSISAGNSAQNLSLSYSQNAINELTFVIDDLSRNIESAKRFRRNSARVKVVLKKETLSKYEKKLEWAIQLLLLAQQLHTIEPGIESPFDKPQTHQDQGTACGYPPRHRARIQLPRWITNKAWEISVAPGLCMNLRAYSVVPDTSPIFEYARQGHLDKMLALYSQGDASPFDMNEFGWSLFHVAGVAGQVSVMKYLMRLDVHSSDPHWPLWGIVACDSWEAADNYTTDTEEYFNFLIENGVFDEENYPKLRKWLEDLFIVGVDLDEYGKAEKNVLDDISPYERRLDPHSGSQSWRTLVLKDSIEYYKMLDLRVQTFTYGTTPKDWTFVWDYPTVEFAAEFWELIENPPLQIPGSWVDDTDSELWYEWMGTDDFHFRIGKRHAYGRIRGCEN
ncbi:hypothetical protein AK830_g11469 [Neonectria ditissima]|uniref:NACHT-NTPase and P-loop NTPases N-terminal domain-containing protein n=1 Tax=Neonectria ditissima TaxID=78410 RepID=A0A0P7B1B2_9HYPO|nr:hypothetical protein AK830_g11469 [Neonectria ditissima]